MCHYPILEWNRCHHGSWMLHGHCHGNLGPSEFKRLDVGVDCHNMELLSLDDISTIMKDKQVWKHH